jgi:hypothetical protein
MPEGVPARKLQVEVKYDAAERHLKAGSFDELVYARCREKLVFTTMPHGDNGDSTLSISFGKLHRMARPFRQEPVGMR